MSQRVCILAVLLAAFGLSSTAAARELTFGVVSDDVQTARARLAGVAAVLASTLNETGDEETRVDDVSIVILPDVKQMAAAMKEGRVQLFADSPFSALYVAKHGNGRPTLRRWKRGVASYNSVFVTTSASPIRSLTELRDARIAFEDKSSTSGYLLPRGLMEQAGLPVEIIADRRMFPRAGAVGGVFTKSDDSSLIWLLVQRIEAAAVDPQTFARFDAAHPGALRIFAETLSVPRQLLIQSNDLPEPLAAAVREALVGLHASDAGRAALLAWDDTAKLDPLPPEAIAGVDFINGELQRFERDLTAE